MRAAIALALAALTISGAADAQSPASFAGEYRMQGKGYGAADAAYDGTCSIVPDGQAYRVSCYNRDTRHTYTGKGLASGSTFSIFIGDLLRGDHNAIFAGEYLVVYTRRADGVLEGRWLHAPSAAAGSETLTPVR